MNTARWRQAPAGAPCDAGRRPHDGDVRRRRGTSPSPRTSRPPPISQAEKHKPTTLRRPHRAHVRGRTRLTRSRCTWRTDATVKTAQAQIAKSGEGPGFKSGARDGARDAQRAADTPNLGATTPCSTRSASRAWTPKTKYLYRVGDGTNWSEWFEFETASATPIRSRSSTSATRRTTSRSTGRASCRQAFEDAPEAKLIVHAGDLIDTPDADSQWGEWFSAGRWINGHESRPSPRPATTSTAARRSRRSGTRAFAWPENGPQGTGRDLRRAQGHRVLHGLPGRALHLDELQRRGRRLGAAPGVPQRPGPRGSRACCRTTRTSGPSSTLPPPDVLQRSRPATTRRSARRGCRSSSATASIWSSRATITPTLAATSPQGTTTPAATARCTSSRSPARRCTSADDSNWVDERRASRKKIGMNTQLYQVISVDGDKLVYKAKTATGRLHDQFTIDKPAGRAEDRSPRTSPTCKPAGRRRHACRHALARRSARRAGLGALRPRRRARTTRRPAPPPRSRAPRPTRR